MAFFIPKTWRSYHFHIILFLVLLVIGIALLLTTIFFPVPTAVYINLQTESLPYFDITQPLTIKIENDDLIKMDEDSSRTNQNFKNFSGYLMVNPGAQITIERIGKGDLKIEVKRQNSKPIELHDKQDEIDTLIKDYIIIIVIDPLTKIHKGRSILFTFSGNLRQINSMNPRVDMDTPIIRSGQIYLMTQTFFSNTHYTLGPYPILTGDGITLISEKEENFLNADNPTEKSYGFITVNDDYGVQIVATNQGKGIIVSRYMTDGYEVKESRWQKISHESLLTTYWTIFLSIISVQGFVHNILPKNDCQPSAKNT